jgi:osmoprotectant transport system permease protein
MNESVLGQQLKLLPDYAAGHLLLSLAALATAIIICLPLAVLVARTKSLQWPVLTFVGVIQTVPGLALLALMVPLLGRIGFLPAYIALVLYSMLPILRNTVTGILGVDPAVHEAARAVGMTSNEMLFRVELPLAAPVILAGIRTSTVWCVGTATLATPVGATSLGNYIFSGLQTQNFTAVLVGCIAAAVLAIVLDQLVGMMERAVAKRRRSLLVAACLGLLLIIGAGMTPALLKSRSESASSPVVVGAKTFTEQYILSALLTNELKLAGIPATSKSSLGSTILFDALAANEVDCYIDYSGTVWANIMKRTEIPSRDTMLNEMSEFLRQKYGVLLLGAVGFENTYSLALTKKKAAELNISSIEELSNHARLLSIGSDYEFFSRPEWASLKTRYDLWFAQQRTFDPSLMYAAVKEGSVDVISAYSTDGRIVAYDLTVLTDPLHALPPYDAVLLLSPNAASRKDVVQALQPLIGSIDNNTIRQANKLVDVDGKSVETAALFLQEELRRVRAIHDSAIR